MSVSLVDFRDWKSTWPILEGPGPSGSRYLIHSPLLDLYQDTLNLRIKSSKGLYSIKRNMVIIISLVVTSF